MAYTDIDDSSAFFQTTLYTGNGSTNAITGVGFQPDWVWLKNRGDSYNHAVFDSVRGVTKFLAVNNSNDEETNAAELTAFGTDGFTLGDADRPNKNTDAYVSWNWKAGTSFSNDVSATSVGSIDSVGSVSTDAGFSIISWTGSGSAATIAHGLGSKLSVYIVKNRSDDGEDWIVYHGANTSAPQTDYIMLNETNATGDSAGVWNDVAPTSTVFSVGTATSTNGSSKNMIAYCFAEKQGYSKFGNYVGNGNADGPFVYLGFKPAWLLVKLSSGTDDWQILDNKRSPNNIVGGYLRTNTNAATINNDVIDFTSNGFKLRTSAGSWNPDGGTFIYLAFAEQPFVTSTGVPATAR